MVYRRLRRRYCSLNMVVVLTLQLTVAVRVALLLTALNCAFYLFVEVTRMDKKRLYFSFKKYPSLSVHSTSSKNSSWNAVFKAMKERSTPTWIFCRFIAEAVST